MKYPKLLVENSELRDCLIEHTIPGWYELIDQTINSLIETESNFDTKRIKDIHSSPSGLIFTLNNPTVLQNRIVRSTEWKSQFVCEICGTESGKCGASLIHRIACSGCRLLHEGKAKMPLGWKRLVQKIVFEIESLGSSPISNIEASAPGLVVLLADSHMNEKQEKCFRQWSNYLRTLCIVCGDDRITGRFCSDHRIAWFH